MPDFDDDSLDETELDELIGLTELYESLDVEVIQQIEDNDAWDAVDADPNAQEDSPIGDIS